MGISFHNATMKKEMVTVTSKTKLKKKWVKPNVLNMLKNGSVLSLKVKYKQINMKKQTSKGWHSAT